MLKIEFNPNTNVLKVESEDSQPFKEKIGIGGWYTVLSKKNDKLFYIEVLEDGSDYIINVHGLEEAEQPPFYDISHLLSAQRIKVLPFTKKYVMVEVKIQNGEYEYYSKSLHIVGKKVDAHKIGERHAKKFYANFSHKDDGTYYFNGGEVATQLYKAQEITRKEYQILNKFL